MCPSLALVFLHICLRFRKTCEDAYMVLREQRKLIITLFLMMVNVGIPELHSVQAIEEHLNKTLDPSLSDPEARQHIQRKIDDAMKEAWKTKWHEKIHIYKHYGFS